MKQYKTILLKQVSIVNFLSVSLAICCIFIWLWVYAIRTRVSKIEPIYILSEHTVEEIPFFPDVPEPIEEVDECIQEIEETEIEKPLQGKDLYISYINEICNEYDFYPDLPYLVQSIMEVESNYIPDLRSSANCIGLMQVSEYWQSDRAASLGVTDMWDPYSNILIGVDLLEDLYFNYANQDIVLAIMMYNMDFSSARAIRRAGGQTDYARTVLSIFEELKGG